LLLCLQTEKYVFQVYRAQSWIFHNRFLLVWSHLVALLLYLLLKLQTDLSIIVLLFCGTACCLIYTSRCSSCHSFTYNKLSCFEPVTVKLLNMAPCKSCCLDPIPSWLHKRLTTHIAPVISGLCNLSMKLGVFPVVLKQCSYNSIAQKVKLGS